MSIDDFLLDGWCFRNIAREILNMTAVRRLVRAGLRTFYRHRTEREKIRRLGKARWNQRFKFAIVRNPWDKVCSQYFYWIKTNQHEMSSRPIEFSDWVQRAYVERDLQYHDKHKMFMPQMDWISDRKGSVIVGFVSRFERLYEEFEEACDRIGIDTALPHVRASKRGSYQDYDGAESKETVRRCFEKDIEYFKYQFQER